MTLMISIKSANDFQRLLSLLSKWIIPIIQGLRKLQKFGGLSILPLENFGELVQGPLVENWAPPKVLLALFSNHCHLV